MTVYGYSANSYKFSFSSEGIRSLTNLGFDLEQFFELLIMSLLCRRLI
jgi:hypothetical protein